MPAGVVMKRLSLSLLPISNSSLLRNFICPNGHSQPQGTHTAGHLLNSILYSPQNPGIFAENIAIGRPHFGPTT
ncbi:MAG TPA: hypothetical protein VFW40_04435, partial [Capsulimonadaceae bacterium]|nr:hypothetical protein [Capsulimonadaceae bacterium]